MSADEHAYSPIADSADTPLRGALERLDQAIDRLESAVATGERVRLEERQQVRRAMDDARVRETRARESGKTVAGRLDGLISRLETVLGT